MPLVNQGRAGLDAANRPQWLRTNEHVQQQFIGRQQPIELIEPNNPPRPVRRRMHELHDERNPEPEDRPLTIAEMELNAMEEIEGLAKKPNYTISDLPEGRIKTKIPGFKLAYDSYEECSRRLRGSLIIVRGSPYVVNGVYNDKTGIVMALQDGAQKEYWCSYNAVESLRTPPPVYVTIHGDHAGTYWLCRRPSFPHDRQHGRHHGDYIQGLTQRNGMMKRVGSTDFNHGRGMVSLYQIAKAMSLKDDTRFDSKVDELMRKGILGQVRLSDNVAVYLKKDDVLLEYKGRELGKLKDDSVRLGDEDKDTPWICEDLRAIGLTC